MVHISSVASIEQAICRAVKYRNLNALITETFDLARHQAHVAVQKSINPFPIVIKDNFAVENVRTTCGSRMLENFIAPYTATVVQRLINAGGSILGKSNMDEFSMGTSSLYSFFGPVKNPWTERVISDPKTTQNCANDWILAGGSSGGSAVAVATGFAKIALGSDTGGSTRNPASFCGVSGLKPSYGILSRHGLIPLVNSLDCVAILGRSIEDLFWAMSIMSGRDENDSTTIETPKDFFVGENPSLNMQDLVIGIPKEYFTYDLDAECSQACDNVATILHEAGCSIKQVSLPHTEFSLACYQVLAACEISSNMARFDGVQFGYRAGENHSTAQMYATGRNIGFNEVVRRRILAGNYFLLRQHYDEYYGRAMRVRRLIANDFYRLFRPEKYKYDYNDMATKGGAEGENCPTKIDILLTPVASSTAPWRSQFEMDEHGYGRERKDDYYTQPVNMAGLPAVSLPVGTCQKGLPIGVQLIADWMDDSRLLAVAKYVENKVHFNLPQF